MNRAATLLDRRPGWVPAGYALRSTATGSAEPGLGQDAEQTLLVYTRRWSAGDFTFPLVVCIAPPGAPDLVATTPQFGVPLDLGVAGVDAVYHDGILVARTDAGGDFAGLRWRSGEVHSITARSATGTFAVRGPRSVARSELVAVLRSLSPDA